MAKPIKLFQSLETVYQSLGIRTSQTYFKDRASPKCYFLVIAMTFYLISSIAFFIFEAKSVAEYGDSFYIVSSLTALIFHIVTYAREGPQMHQLNGKFENIFQTKIDNQATATKYRQLHAKIEQMCRFFNITLVQITVPMFVLPVLFVTIFNYFILDLGDESFYLSSPISFPMNLKTWHGYSVACFMESVGGYSTCLASVPLICVLVGLCWILSAIADDLANDLRELNVTINDKSSKRDAAFIQFCNIAKRLSDAKQFVIEFSQLYKYKIFVVFLWTLSTICCNLLVLQHNRHTLNDMSNPFEFINGDVKRVNLMIWSFVTIYAFCEMGETVTSQFNIIEESLNECNWYLFSLKLQRIHLIVLANAQHPTTVNGFGNLVCTRDSMKKTIKASFSYFMALRQFD